jgi:hypothetical protein
MKSCETDLKEMIPRNFVQASLSSRNIIQARLSLILKISNSTFTRFTLFVLLNDLAKH